MENCTAELNAARVEMTKFHRPLLRYAVHAEVSSTCVEAIAARSGAIKYGATIFCSSCSVKFPGW